MWKAFKLLSHISSIHATGHAKACNSQVDNYEFEVPRDSQTTFLKDVYCQQCYLKSMKSSFL